MSLAKYMYKVHVTVYLWAVYSDGYNFCIQLLLFKTLTYQYIKNTIVVEKWKILYSTNGP